MYQKLSTLDTTEKLKNDTEIQSWIKELTEDAHFKAG